MTDISQLEPIEVVERPIYLNYHYEVSERAARFLRALREGRLIGARSTGSGKVLVPPGAVCAETGLPVRDEAIALPDVGTVMSFTTVHLPIPGSRLKPPFVVAYVLLDGADQSFSHLVAECDPTAVTIGARVRAKWKPDSEWGYGLENIEYFVLTAEPAVDVDAVRAERLAEAAKHA